MLQTIKNLAQKILPKQEFRTPLAPDTRVKTPQGEKVIFNKAKSESGPPPNATKKILANKLATPRLSPTLTPTPTRALPKPTNMKNAELAEKIRKGFIKYGGENLPVATLAASFADETMKYPILKRYPYLLPSIALKETSGGKHQAYKHNPMNYGIYLQQAGQFNPESPEEVIMKSARAIGGEQSLYNKFQETGNLDDFINTYAPPVENDTKKYRQDLDYFFNLFQ